MRYIFFATLVIFGLNSFADNLNPILPRPTTNTELPPPPPVISKPTQKNKYSTHVNQYREGDNLITEIPLRDMTIAERAKAFEISQVVASKLLRAWFAQVIHVQLPALSADRLHEIEAKSTAELQQYLQDQKLKGHMPTAEDIVNETSTTLETNNKLKTRSAALISYDELINTVNQSLTTVLEQDNQNKTLEEKAIATLPQIIPSAFMVVASYKLPSFLTRLIQSKSGFSVAGKNLITGNALAALTKGSATFALTIRPALRVTTNLVTGKTVKNYNFDWTVPMWLFKDFGNSKGEMFIPGANGRLGVGVLWGDFDENLSNIGGITVGRSMNFAVKTHLDANSNGFVPHNYNVKFGVMSAQVSNLTQALHLNTFLRGGYVMATKQWGVRANYSRGNYWEVGYTVNFENLTDKVLINEETLDQLLVDIAGDIPGATVATQNGKIEVKVPDQKPEIQPTTQAPAIKPSVAPSTTVVPNLIPDVTLKNPPHQQKETSQEKPATH